MKAILAILFALSIVSCNRGHSRVDNTEVTICSDLKKTAISILESSKLSNIEKTVIRQLVEDSLFFSIDDIPILLSDDSILKKHDFNDKLLVEICYRNNVEKSNGKREIDYRTTDLLLFDRKTDKILASYRLTGCHNNSYEVKVIDWNGDETFEISAQLSSPVQSIPVINNFLEIIGFDETESKLKEIFSLDTDNRNCNSPNGTQKGHQIITKYSFISPRKIKLVKKYYSFNCTDFEFTSPIQNKSIDSTVVNTIKWNDKNFAYQ